MRGGADADPVGAVQGWLLKAAVGEMHKSLWLREAFILTDHRLQRAREEGYLYVNVRPVWEYDTARVLKEEDF